MDESMAKGIDQSGDTTAGDTRTGGAAANGMRAGEREDGIGDRLARLALVWGLATVWVVVDQLVKAWALKALWAGDIEVIPGFLWFNLTRNPGSSFGLFPHGRVFFIAVSVLLMGVGLWAPLVMGGRRVSLGTIGLGLLVGGGIGNFIDRVFRGGKVVDFIDFRFFPIFNVADIGIVIGTGLVFIYLAATLFRSEAKPE